MKIVAVAALLFLSSFVQASGQEQLGGIFVPIEPCAVTYLLPLTSGVQAYLEVRHYCGVPEEATAVFLNMKAGGSATAGKVYVWPYGNAIPSYSQFNYTPNYSEGAPHSGQALVRLCMLDDTSCGELDITVQSTTNVNFSAIVEGYIVSSQ